MQIKSDIEKQKMINYFKVHQISLKKVLSNIFNKKIVNIKYLGNYKLEKLVEYKFCVLKFNVMLEDYSNFKVAIRLIDYFKIRENLYCYWLFCQENYNLIQSNIMQKANIVNHNSEKYEKRFEMQLFEINKKIYQTSFVDIIDLKKYCKLKLKRNNYIVNELLFVAIWR